MKKWLSIVLMFCLALACVPAAADSLCAGPYTLDLSKGPVTFSWESYNSMDWDEFKETPEGKLCNTCYAAEATGLIVYLGGDSESGYYRSRWDLDYDGSADMYVTEDYTVFTTTFEVAPTNTCGVSITLDVAMPASNSVSLPYYSPLTIVLSLPETYSDAAGSYAIENGEAAFVKPAKAAASANVPDSITVSGVTVPVTKIADNAFKGQKKLTKVTIGANIKEIGKNAFANCAKLKTIKGGANVEIIGDSAFSGCKALKSFTIGAKVVKIGKKAFYKCSALKKITIKSKLLTAKTVGSSAFKGIYKTATIKVPKAVKKDYSKWLLKKGIKKTMKIK